MPSLQWLQQYQKIKHQLDCSYDLEAQFRKDKIGSMEVKHLDIGMLNCPSGKLIACDPMTSLMDAPALLQTIERGLYKVKVCVVPTKRYGDRYSCVKLEITDEIPVRYELGVTGIEDLECELDDDLLENEVFGFGVDTATACLCDVQAQLDFQQYWTKHVAEKQDHEPYEYHFSHLMAQNAKAHPLYQTSLGDWLNYTIPHSSLNITMFTTGFGDGCYPVYFGYNAKDQICAVYISFFDIQECFDQTNCPKLFHLFSYLLRAEACRYEIVL